MSRHRAMGQGDVRKMTRRYFSPEGELRLEAGERVVIRKLVNEDVAVVVRASGAERTVFRGDMAGLNKRGAR